MIYRFENVSYDDSVGVIHQPEKEIKLTRIQKKLLEYFLAHPAQVISKQRLMEDVWGRIVTENSVDQVISALRGFLEPNPAKPVCIVTHYGQGFSFEADFSRDDDARPDIEANQPAPSKRRWPVFALLVPVVLLLIFFVAWPPEQEKIASVNQAGEHMLILPMTFQDESIGEIEQQGMKALMRSTFDQLQSEGEMIFDETSLTTKQAIEKHWRLEKDLVVMRSNVIKNGDIYQAVIELSKGLKTVEKTTITAPSLNALMSNQIMFISEYQRLDGSDTLSQLLPQDADQLYIEALAYRKSGNLAKAKALINQLLNDKQDHYRARLSLAEILLAEKNHSESLSQLTTLKSTPAYRILGTEIELHLAEIRLEQKEFALLIDELRRYQADHPDISSVKKAKIQLKIADAYLGSADNKNALTFFKRALINLDEQLNPAIFAKSFYGQGTVRMSGVIDEVVEGLFQKSLSYAESAGDLHQQTLALNAMSHIALSAFEWEKAIVLKREALAIMALENDKAGVASGLGTLVAIFNLRGQFTEAGQVNERLGRIARELQSDPLMLHYLHYDAILAMNEFDWNRAKAKMDKQIVLAEQTKNYSMILNNAFLALELILLKKDASAFMPEWDKRTALIKDLGFERFQIYMDLYLARYHKLIGDDEKAIALIDAVSTKAIASGDIKILVDAQNQLAEIYLKIDAEKALAILNTLEEHNPHPNPYLELKARALDKLGKKIDALNLLNQAKSVYHESWTAENQALYETIEQSLN